MRASTAVLLVSTFVIQVLSQRYRPEPNTFQEQPRVSSQSCPEKNGRFPTRTCDGYIECKDGVAEEKLCPDGLLFNPAVGIFAFPCQYPIDVDCTGREQTQPAQPTEDCPHQYGYYRLGDQNNCGQFMNCVEGRGYTFDCPEGLAFDGDSYRCDWPDQVSSCDAEAYLGFTCPEEPSVRGLGDPGFRYFRSANDCQRYYVCVNSRPRLYNCGEGSAFNDITNQCDGIENVTGCASQYNVDYDRSAINPRYKPRN